MKDLQGWIKITVHVQSPLCMDLILSYARSSVPVGDNVCMGIDRKNAEGKKSCVTIARMVYAERSQSDLSVGVSF